ncbi:cell division control protein 6 [Sporothrix brasiliensis 5110]|uniref:Cell division control protein 6 n=1 Tax=Sporothrix brasiliensis 5110 TaxID=1398154 RepID=A0A0C2IEC6_9PEZI|nr:cell division control protein 6 [Sporothrix brasiliensis 5110]KIH87616.1 cell division control protein 6 [Sporothrix brasiliensis 5110]
MVAFSLGKRSRASDVEDADASLSLKRVRRSTRSFVVNDENQDPNAVTFEDALAADADATPKVRRAISTNSTLVSPTKTSPTKRAVSVAGVPLTPSTPRYRDGLGTISASRSTTATTPATPVTPSTPRHRVMSAGRLSRRTTPHGLFSKPSEGLGGDTTPTTPRTPSGSVQTVYHVARQLFARSSGMAAGSLVGRDDERARLRTFLSANCGSDAATFKSDCGCLYVSGPPGTGKSAMVNEMTEQVCTEQSGSVRKAYVNCMSIRSSNDLYSTLLRLLVLGTGSEDDENNSDEQAAEAMGVDLTETNAVNALQAMFLPKASKKAASAKAAGSPSTYLVVLDEIDHILTLDLESLYRVMEWSMLKTSRLVLVGIANALDLTDRFLPRLKSRNLQPELLPFLPYTAPQIKNIITTRLKTVLQTTLPSVPEASASAPAPTNFLPFFHPAAIELCSRKVASQTGDLRKAFEILRRALDLVESEAREKYLNDARDACNATTSNVLTTPTKKQPLAENMNLASSPPASAASSRTVPKRSSWASWAAQNLTIENAPRVSIGHLNKVTASAFGNGAQQRLKGLNLQQKAALCALMAFEKWSREAYAATQAAAQTNTSLQPSSGVKKLVKAPTPSRLQAPGGGAAGTAAPTIKKLYATYNLMCKRDAVLHPLSSSEFREVVGSLETLSLVTAVDGRNGSFAVLQSAPGSGSGRRGRRPGGAVSNSMMGGGSSGVTGVAGDEKRVASCVGEKELRQALDGAGADILQSILSGEALD